MAGLEQLAVDLEQPLNSVIREYAGAEKFSRMMAELHESCPGLVAGSSNEGGRRVVYLKRNASGQEIAAIQKRFEGLPVTVQFSSPVPEDEAAHLNVEMMDALRSQFGSSVRGVSFDPRTGGFILKLVGANSQAALEKIDAAVQSLEKAKNITTRTVIQHTERAATSGSNAIVMGGAVLSTCTSAFSVTSSTNVKGIITADHCDNSQAYGSDWSVLRFGGAARTDISSLGTTVWRGDMQWHIANDQTSVVPKFRAGSKDYKYVYAVGAASIGDYVCRYGMVTGAHCSKVTNGCGWFSYDEPVHREFGCMTYVEDNEGTNGDSGGPYFIGTTAFGVHSGWDRHIFYHNVYSPIHRLDKFLPGLRVLM